MVDSFAAVLKQRVSAGFAPAVVGLDPRLAALPEGLAPDASPADRILAFYRETIPLLAPHVPVVKPNVAFFEQYGWEGFRAYQATCELAQNAGLLVLGDIKRGDIGSTALAYAAGHLSWSDAVTLHPYLGYDSVEPFLRACREAGKGAFVLVRTSNPSASEFQGLPIEDQDLSAAVARAVHRWGEDSGDPEGYSNVGAVVGATAAGEIARLRALMPRAWFLLPGVGAQGASVEAVAPAFDRQGLGALVSQSRGVMQCFDPGDPEWREQISQAAMAFATDVRSVAGTPQV
ncbi:MAG: orotidine-5'-phosphate decarboxylase [Planctomycetota bacterium]|nr:orotidine-5'-phosphate decarboxylase [Planctomycetota bacterium]